MNRVEDLLQFVKVLATVDAKMSEGGDGNFWEARKEYITAQATYDFRIGDQVKVFCRPIIESLRTWGGNWCRKHEDSIGFVGKVAAITPYGIHVSFEVQEGCQEGCYPCYALHNVSAVARVVKQRDPTDEPAKDAQPEFKPFDKVLVRDEDNEPWAPDIYRRHSSDKICPHNTFRGCFRKCIPYEGNEHLAWKTEAPDWE